MKASEDTNENVLKLARKGFKSLLLKKINKEFPTAKFNEVAGWKLASGFQKYESMEFEFWLKAQENPDAYKDILRFAEDVGGWWYIYDKNFVLDNKCNLKNSIPIWKFAKMDKWKNMVETYLKNNKEAEGIDFFKKEEDDFWNMTIEQVLNIKPKAPVKPENDEVNE